MNNKYLLPAKQKQDFQSVLDFLRGQYGTVHYDSTNEGTIILTEKEVAVEHQKVLGISPYQKAA